MGTAGDLFAFVFFASFILFIYTYAAFGLAYVIGHAEISENFRSAWSAWANRGRLDDDRRDPFLLRLIECPACFGAWTGLVMGLLVCESIPLVPNWLIVVLLTFYTSATNFVLGKKTGLIH